MSLCWECNNNPSDHQPRSYRNVNTGKLYRGTRNFCCDACEDKYVARGLKNDPELASLFVIVQ